MPRQRRTTPPAATPRPGMTTATVFNSGLEVWLFDAGALDRLRASPAFDPVDEGALRPLFADGSLVAWSLLQDDAVHVGVLVGEPLTADELAVAAWLEPQRAFLSLPTGQLRIESNDSAPMLPEGGSDEGGRVSVPPGDYRLTLYRIDDEALSREGRTWSGPREVIVLSPGGTPADAATEILPFEPRRDLSWVGRYTINGDRGDILVWFADPWTTATANLDRQAVAALRLEPGRCLRITLRKPKLSLVITYADTWADAAKLVPPDLDLAEYGWGALVTMADWGVEALFCRRDRTTTGIKPQYLKTWLPARIERLDVVAEPPKRIRGPVILDTPGRAFWRADLTACHYYRDLQLLTAKLMSRVEGIPWGEALPLERALTLVDEQFRRAGLEPAGDFAFDVARPAGPVEYTNRLYLGRPDLFGVVWGSADVFECFFCTERDDGGWVLTGTVNERVAEAMSANPRLATRSFSGRLAGGADAHVAHLADLGGKRRPAPAGLEDAVVAYERYLVTALGF